MGTVADKLELTEPLVEVEIEEKTDEDCPVCNKAYWPCLVYKAATYSGKKAALDKLCTVNPTKKDAICQEIYLYSQAEIDAFLKDLMTKPTDPLALGSHVGSIDVALVRAWKIVGNVPNMLVTPIQP